MKQRDTSSISVRIRQLIINLTVPLCVLSLFMLAVFIAYSLEYATVSRNIATASRFNQNFKDEVDLKMYYFVTGSSEEIPLDEVATAEELANELLGSTRNRDSRRAVGSVLNLCGNLTDCITGIEETEGYDSRMHQLETNVYVITELIDSQLTVFKNLYLKDREIRNIIVVDDYISPVLEHYISDRDNPGFTDSPSFDVFMDDLRSSNPQDFARRYDVSDDNVPLMYISGMLLSRVLRTTGAGRIWAPGVTLCDGMIYEFTENRKILPPGHDFEEDIIACAKNIGRRYMGLEERGRALENISLKIFDSTRKYHGMGGRERLLMRIAALLHDCGKYISMSDSGECSYDIIMSTEIIGLSHLEREIVANVVRYNHSSFVYFAAQEMVTDLDHDSYLTITRLTAILRIANGLDRSHMQKFQDLKAKVKDGMLVITVSAEEDLTMERGLFGDRADFFEEVYGIRPVIRQR